ncbi:MAG: helix-turn-helix domain-containing protein [Actinomycetota bacterium]|nr:helix-turn-helix domain-containing protein [Actinomycetota bacterium]
MTPTHPRRCPDPEDQPTVPVWPATGLILGMSRQATYDAVTRGDIPSIRVGRRLLVPTAALRRMLQLDDEPRPAA